MSKYVLLGFAAAIVYPNEVLRWVGARTGWVFARRHLILYEAAAVILMLTATLLLMPFSPLLDWWDPVIYVGVVGLVRLLYWVGEAVVRGLFDV
jgi:hypothetical protein